MITIDDKPVFLMEPDYSSNPTMNLSRAIKMFDGRNGRDFGIFEGKIGVFSMRFKYVLSSRSEIDKVEEFFNFIGGRFKDFYVPSWRNEIEVVNYNDNLMTIKNINYEKLLERDSKTGDYIFVYNEDGTLHINKVLEATEGVDEQILTLEEPLDALEGSYICGIVYNMRLTDDALDFNYFTYEKAVVELGFTEEVGYGDIISKKFIPPVVSYTDFYTSNVSVTSFQDVAVLIIDDMEEDPFDLVSSVSGSEHQETVVHYTSDNEEAMEFTSGVGASTHDTTVVAILTGGFDYELDVDFSDSVVPEDRLELTTMVTSSLNSV